MNKSFFAFAIGLILCSLAWSAGPRTQTNKSTTLQAPHEPLSIRFANAGASQNNPATEVPDFQRHIGPILGRLGCNGRACHGSFQGRGGFQLSLFGYDFKADHAALLANQSGRVDTNDVEASLILAKPTDADMHEGGVRMDKGSWQYNVLRKWIAAGALFTGKLQTLERLEVEPREVLFNHANDQAPLRVIAHWADGSKENVTELCRFTTNDDSVAEIDENGVVKSVGAGDTHVVVSYDKAVVPVAIMRSMEIDRSRINAPHPSGHPIDELVSTKLDKLRIVPSELCDDYDFIRRASLDVTGILPSPTRVKQFVTNNSPDKRVKLINDLLEEPGYAAWWATRLSDWTGNSEAQLKNFYPVRGVASQSWFAWLEKRIAENMAYDKIVEGIVTAETRLPGESYLDYCQTMSDACRNIDKAVFAARPGLPQFWGRENFRMPEERAIGFAYTFLGIRIQCAQCHKHPFDQWSKDDFDKFAVLFSSVQANGNVVGNDARDDRNKMLAELTDGKELNGGELRKRIYEAAQAGEVVPFPELVVREGMRVKPDKEAKKGDSKDDKKTAKMKQKQLQKQNQNQLQKPPIASGHILGELETITLADDPRDSLMHWLREPNNPYFAKAIVNRVWSNYFGIGIVNPTDDMNLGNPPSNSPLLEYLADQFIRSGYDLKTLHRIILTSDTYQRSSQPNASNAADQRNFGRHVPRRLPAEVIRDSVYLATASDEDADQARSSLSNLAIGGQIDNSYKQNGRDFALQVFGQSSRESNCDCDRSDQPNLLQSIYLQNDIDMHRQLNQANGWVAKTVVSSTGQPLRAIVSTGDSDGGGGGKQQAAEAMRKQLVQRVEMFQSLSPQKQERLKPQLDREIRRANERFQRFGFETVTIESLGKAKADASDKQLDKANAIAPVDNAKQSELFDDWVSAAYLRTLNRLPDNDERQIAITFINEAERPGEGLESLMWTLLNTKEFILSH